MPSHRSIELLGFSSKILDLFRRWKNAKLHEFQVLENADLTGCYIGLQSFNPALDTFIDRALFARLSDQFEPGDCQRRRETGFWRPVFDPLQVGPAPGLDADQNKKGKPDSARSAGRSGRTGSASSTLGSPLSPALRLRSGCFPLCIYRQLHLTSPTSAYLHSLRPTGMHSSYPPTAGSSPTLLVPPPVCTAPQSAIRRRHSRTIFPCSLPSPT